VGDDAEQGRAPQRQRDAADDERHMRGIRPSKYPQESPHLSSPGRMPADTARSPLPMHYLEIRLTGIGGYFGIRPIGDEGAAKHFSRRVT